MLTTLLTALLVSVAPASTEIVLARFSHVGLDDANLKKARARLVSELKEADASLVKPVTAVDDACITSPECLKGAIGPHRGALVVDILRIGPMVTVTAELYDQSGAKVASVETATDTTAFDEGGVLLGTDILDPVRDLAPPVDVSPMDTTDTTKDAATSGTAATTTSDTSSSSATASAGEEAFPIVPTIFMVAGGVVVASALAVGVVSLVGVISQAQVLQTPSTTTSEKDLAVTLGRASLVGIGLGAIAVVVGGGVAAAGFFVE